MKNSTKTLVWIATSVLFVGCGFKEKDAPGTGSAYGFTRNMQAESSKATALTDTQKQELGKRLKQLSATVPSTTLTLGEYSSDATGKAKQDQDTAGLSDDGKSMLKLLQDKSQCDLEPGKATTTGKQTDAAGAETDTAKSVAGSKCPFTMQSTEKEVDKTTSQDVANQRFSGTAVYDRTVSSSLADASWEKKTGLTSSGETTHRQTSYTGVSTPIGATSANPNVKVDGLTTYRETSDKSYVFSDQAKWKVSMAREYYRFNQDLHSQQIFKFDGPSSPTIFITAYVDNSTARIAVNNEPYTSDRLKAEFGIDIDPTK